MWQREEVRGTSGRRVSASSDGSPGLDHSYEFVRDKLALLEPGGIRKNGVKCSFSNLKPAN